MVYQVTFLLMIELKRVKKQKMYQLFYYNLLLTPNKPPILFFMY